MTAPVLRAHCQRPVRGRSPAGPPLCRAEAARHRLRVAEAKAQQAWADVELAKAELLNADELLASARTRFGVAWPAVRQGMAPSTQPADRMAEADE